MQVGKVTNNLLEKIQSFSGGGLSRPADLGLLIEVARLKNRSQELQDLSFTAKFVTKAFGIMQRIGPDGEGYERLLKEFTDNLNKASGLIRTLIDGAGKDAERKFADEYLAASQESLVNLLTLLRDLGWYKNWSLDHRPGKND